MVETELFHQGRRRRYFRCRNCQLTFVPKAFHLAPIDEKSHYDLHQNSPDDQGYRRFLSRLFEPVGCRLAPGSSGLDFGSGPGPTLSVMFEEAGHRVVIFDQFYAPDRSCLSSKYDFVTASEVIEHFRDPAMELERLWGCVKPGGVLGLMTKMALDAEAFAAWHYKNDPTHICFYSLKTFEWIGHKFSWRLEVIDQDVVFFYKE